MHVEVFVPHLPPTHPWKIALSDKSLHLPAHKQPISSSSRAQFIPLYLQGMTSNKSLLNTTNLYNDSIKIFKIISFLRGCWVKARSHAMWAMGLQKSFIIQWTYMLSSPAESFWHCGVWGMRLRHNTHAAPTATTLIDDLAQLILSASWLLVPAPKHTAPSLLSLSLLSWLFLFHWSSGCMEFLRIPN